MDADPSNGRRAALRSEDEIARLVGRSNIVSKVRCLTPFQAQVLACMLAEPQAGVMSCVCWNARQYLRYLSG